MGLLWPLRLQRFDVTSQLGGDADFVDSKNETFLHGHAYNPSKVLNFFSFDPKCRITLVHSLKTIRGDWRVYAGVPFFPLPYTSLFVKSLRKENDKDSIL